MQSSLVWLAQPAGSEMRAQHVHIHARLKMGAGQSAQHRAVALHVAECNLAFKLSDQISVVASQSLLWLDKRSSQIISLIFDSEPINTRNLDILCSLFTQP